MSESVISALISGAVTLVCMIITVLVESNKTRNAMEKHQAVTDEKITHLTEEVKMHNNFARRMPVVEEQIKVANHRIEDLEKECKATRNDGK